MKCLDIFRRLFLLAYGTARIADFDHVQSSSSLEKTIVSLPDDIIEYILSFSVDVLILNRASLYRTYIRTLHRFGVTDASVYDELPLLYQTVPFNTLHNLYLLAGNSNFCQEFESEKAAIRCLSWSLGPVGCALYLARAADVKSDNYLFLMNRMVHLMSFNFQSIQHRYLFFSWGLSRFIEGYVDDIDRLFQIQAPEELYCPFCIAEKDLLLKLAQQTVGSTRALNGFKRKMAFSLMCLPEASTNEIILLLGKEIPAAELFRPFPSDLVLPEEICVLNYARNEEVIIALLDDLQHLVPESVISELWLENVIRFGGEKEIDGLTIKNIWKVLEIELTGLSFIWGRASVRAAWVRCLDRVAGVEDAGARLAFTIAFNPRRLADGFYSQWYLAKDAISIVHGCIVEISIAESEVSKEFIDIWYEALCAAPALELPLAVDGMKLIQCMMKAYSMAERKHNHAGRDRIFELFQKNAGYLRMSLVNLEVEFLVPSFMWKFYAYQDIGNCLVLDKIICSYCFGIDRQHLRLLKHFIRQCPSRMISEVMGVMRNSKDPPFVVNNRNFLLEYARVIQSLDTNGCFCWMPRIN